MRRILPTRSAAAQAIRSYSPVAAGPWRITIAVCSFLLACDTYARRLSSWKPCPAQKLCADASLSSTASMMLRAPFAAAHAGGAKYPAAEPAPAHCRIEHHQPDPPITLGRIVAEQLDVADQLATGGVDPERELIVRAAARRQRAQLLLTRRRSRRRALVCDVVVAAPFVQTLQLRRVRRRETSHRVIADRRHAGATNRNAPRRRAPAYRML